MREAKEQLARIGRLHKLYERVKKLEQSMGKPPNSSPAES
jgi:hypothetical protein